jgi:uncharacterized damage-inducible protein DinB
MSYHVRPGSDEYGAFYSGYVDRVPEGDLVAILEHQIEDTLALLRSVPDEDGDRRYAPGKWSVKEVVGHLADTERVMSYRALRVARGDSTPLPGFEQDDYVAAADFSRRSLAILLSELEVLRRGTVALFDSLTEEDWARRGTASGHPVTPRSLACIIAGHELHHRQVLMERYLPVP